MYSCGRRVVDEPGARFSSPLCRYRGVMTAPNRLAQETSPYLRQHKDNPVDWYPWGPEAFAAAKERNVPILLSVGYSACHWCHVMAHECFEDDVVAIVMNERFVNVKVDREERPDVDSVYMDAVQAMAGRGGWPMTVFMTPTGEPFYGGTYFPKPQFLQLMDAIDDVWRTRPADIQQNIDALVDAIGRTSRVEPAVDLPGAEHIDRCLRQLAASFDHAWGGFGAAPKFPSTLQLDVALRALVRGDNLHYEIVTTTLDAMASGGMYDHLGGGFARYSTDERWLVPHFEKMLYDQALLARIYVHGALILDQPHWRQVASETIDYVLAELHHPDGGFYSAEDADSPDEQGHGLEGLFQTWTSAEICDVLGDSADIALDWYEVRATDADGGNFEGRTILTRLVHRGELLRPTEVEAVRQRLLEARSSRRRPGLDDKVITEWNALMLATLSEAATAFDRPDWLAAAIANGEFLLRELRRPDGRWHRSWHADGAPRSRHEALAADHAALIDAFTRLAEASGESRWIGAAMATADTMLDHFWDHDHGGLFTTADDGEALVVRQKDLLDNATPSANALAAVALLRLASLTGEQRYANHADRILRLLGSIMDSAPTAFSHALTAVDLRTFGVTEIVITGDRSDLCEEVWSTWRPNAVLAWGEPYDSPLWRHRSDGFAYVCSNFTCDLPASDVPSLAEQLRPGFRGSVGS